MSPFFYSLCLCLFIEPTDHQKSNRLDHIYIKFGDYKILYLITKELHNIKDKSSDSVAALGVSNLIIRRKKRNTPTDQCFPCFR